MPCILIEEDSEGVRDLLERVFRREGFHVLVAANGQEAFRLFQVSGGAVDVVLLGLGTPGRGGLHTLARLRELDPDIRCVLISGNVGSLRPAELVALGDVKIVEKPFNVANLVQTVRAVVGQDRHQSW